MLHGMYDEQVFDSLDGGDEGLGADPSHAPRDEALCDFVLGFGDRLLLLAHVLVVKYNKV